MIRFDLNQATHHFEPNDGSTPLAEISHHATVVSFISGADLELLKPFLASLKKITIAFPSFRDGRGFTHARTLREYYRFSGDLRAEGEILPDQAQALRRSGFDAVILRSESELESWKKHAKSFFQFTYQQKLFQTR